MPAREASGSWGACIFFLVLINTVKQPSRVAVARSRAWIIVECGDHLGEPAFLDAKPCFSRAHRAPFYFQCSAGTSSRPLHYSGSVSSAAPGYCVLPACYLTWPSPFGILGNNGRQTPAKRNVGPEDSNAALCRRLWHDVSLKWSTLRLA